MAIVDQKSSSLERNEASRRIKSGVWDVRYNIESATDVWTLNLRELHKELSDLLRSPRDYELYMKAPELFIDSYFGKDTYRSMMAHRHDNSEFIRMKIREDFPIFERKKNTPKRSAPVKTVPAFRIHDGGNLLVELQKRFDRWAGKALRELQRTA